MLRYSWPALNPEDNCNELVVDGVDYGGANKTCADAVSQSGGVLTWTFNGVLDTITTAGQPETAPGRAYFTQVNSGKQYGLDADSFTGTTSPLPPTIKPPKPTA